MSTWRVPEAHRTRIEALVTAGTYRSLSEGVTDLVERGLQALDHPKQDKEKGEEKEFFWIAMQRTGRKVEGTGEQIWYNVLNPGPVLGRCAIHGVRYITGPTDKAYKTWVSRFLLDASNKWGAGHAIRQGTPVAWAYGSEGTSVWGDLPVLQEEHPTLRVDVERSATILVDGPPDELSGQFFLRVSRAPPPT